MSTMQPTCHSLSSSLPFGLITVSWMRGLVEPSSKAALDNACEDISVSFTWTWQEKNIFIIMQMPVYSHL